MTPLSMRTARTLALLSLLTLAMAAQDLPLGQPVVCCIAWRCKELREYTWRLTKTGVEVLAEGQWCSVRLDHFPMIRVFRGTPDPEQDPCVLLRCFPSDLRK